MARWNEDGSQKVQESQIDFSKYDDPVTFGREVLGEDYTPDVIEAMRTVMVSGNTIFRSANGTGKSHGLARLAIWFLLRYEDAQVYTCAAPPESNLRNILWGEIGYLVEKYKHLFHGKFKINDLKITRIDNAKSFLAGVTIPTTGTPAKREAAFSGKHAPHMLFIADEGDGVPTEVYRGIESCMSGGECRLVVSFNPRNPSGRIYQMEKAGEARVVELSAFRHPNVITGEDIIPGAVSRHITLRRINEWTEPVQDGEPIDADCFDVPDFLVGTTTESRGGTLYDPLPAGKRRIIEPMFHYMVLGRYPTEGKGQLIRRTWIDRAMERWKQRHARVGRELPDRKPIMGFDVAEEGGDRNCVVFRYGGYVPEFHTWDGVDPKESAERAAELYLQYEPRFCNVDGTGVGAAASPHMEDYNREIEANSVKVASSPKLSCEEGEFFQLRDQLWWQLREWLRKDPNAAIPPDEGLAEELLAPKYEKMGGGSGKIKVSSKDDMRAALGGRSPDLADALALTFYNSDEDGEDTEGLLDVLNRRGQY